MRVYKAKAGDIDNWLRLASEVEDLFGPMVDDEGFNQALRESRHRHHVLREGRGWAARDAADGWYAVFR